MGNKLIMENLNNDPEKVHCIPKSHVLLLMGKFNIKYEFHSGVLRYLRCSLVEIKGHAI